MFQTGIVETVSVQNFTDNTWIPGVIEKQNGPLSYHVKLQDGRMVRRHSDHILVHPGTEETSIVNDDWMNLPDISQDSATALHTKPKGTTKCFILSILYGILLDHPFHQNGMDKTVVLKNLKGEECRDLDNK